MDEAGSGRGDAGNGGAEVKREESGDRVETAPFSTRPTLSLDMGTGHSTIENNTNADYSCTNFGS